jgi:hypothetical protein
MTNSIFQVASIGASLANLLTWAKSYRRRPKAEVSLAHKLGSGSRMRASSCPPLPPSLAP